MTVENSPLFENVAKCTAYALSAIIGVNNRETKIEACGPDVSISCHSKTAEIRIRLSCGDIPDACIVKDNKIVFRVTQGELVKSSCIAWAVRHYRAEVNTASSSRLERMCRDGSFDCYLMVIVCECISRVWKYLSDGSGIRMQ